jgi:hypothetical protein
MVTVHGTTHKTGVKDEPERSNDYYRTNERVSYKLPFVNRVLTDFSGTPSP